MAESRQTDNDVQACIFILALQNHIKNNIVFWVWPDFERPIFRLKGSSSWAAKDSFAATANLWMITSLWGSMKSNTNLVPFMSGKCKRIARHLLFLLWFSWRCKFAEVFAKSTTSKENKANNDLFTFWIRSLFTSAKLHDKLLWLIGGVVCVYTSQLNGTARILAK